MRSPHRPDVVRLEPDGSGNPYTRATPGNWTAPANGPGAGDDLTFSIAIVGAQTITLPALALSVNSVTYQQTTSARTVTLAPNGANVLTVSASIQSVSTETAADTISAPRKLGADSVIVGGSGPSRSAASSPVVQGRLSDGYAILLDLGPAASRP